MTEWWASAARALALVLALAVAMPTIGIAEDLAFHQGHDGTGLLMVSDAAAGADQAADPGLTCHVHCGCHIAVSATVVDQTTPRDGARPSYAWISETGSTVSPDRLPRPPRA